LNPTADKPWRIQGRELPRRDRAWVMGIVNVTPDSFSDGGRFLDPARAIAHGLQLVQEGADIIDVGGESTRPGAQPVEVNEEIRRVLPVIRELSRQTSVPISIDTRHVEVAEAALNAGASIVNDIQANRNDPRLWEAVSGHRAGYVCMHMKGEPLTMQVSPAYADVTEEVLGFMTERLGLLTRSGVTPEQVVLDPGIGFGKTLEHNLELLRHLAEFARFNRPILLGISRKSFLGKLGGEASPDRLPGGIACTAWAVLQGVRLFRTHDVAPTIQALNVMAALGPGDRTS